MLSKLAEYKSKDSISKNFTKRRVCLPSRTKLSDITIFGGILVPQAPTSSMKIVSD